MPALISWSPTLSYFLLFHQYLQSYPKCFHHLLSIPWCYLRFALILNSKLVNLGHFWTGALILILLTWVSLPFWWLDRMAIWIINVLIGFPFMSFSGTDIQPIGSLSSICSTSTRSLKWLPARIETLKKKRKILLFLNQVSFVLQISAIMLNTIPACAKEKFVRSVLEFAVLMNNIIKIHF